MVILGVKLARQRDAAHPSYYIKIHKIFLKIYSKHSYSFTVNLVVLSSWYLFSHVLQLISPSTFVDKEPRFLILCHFGGGCCQSTAHYQPLNKLDKHSIELKPFCDIYTQPVKETLWHHELVWFRPKEFISHVHASSCWYRKTKFAL